MAAITAVMVFWLLAMALIHVTAAPNCFSKWGQRQLWEGCLRLLADRQRSSKGVVWLSRTDLHFDVIKPCVTMKLDKGWIAAFPFHPLHVTSQCNTLDQVDSACFVWVCVSVLARHLSVWSPKLYVNCWTAKKMTRLREEDMLWRWNSSTLC